MAMPAFAQRIDYSEKFEQYAAQSAPAAWLDSSAGRFRTFADPLAPDNMVYGATHPSVRQRSANRKPPGDAPDLGAYATLTGKTFSVAGGFELRGRFLRATDSSLAGVTFFSRMLALWRTSTDTAATMRLYRTGDGALVEDARSTITPAPMMWYRFAIRADAGRVRARVWRDGTDEPLTWDLDVAGDAHEAGRIGLWSAVGGAYFDDLSVIVTADEEEDTTPPVITIAPIPAFTNQNVTPAITVNEPATVVSTLNGVLYGGAAITEERAHTLLVTATDAAGNTGTASATFTIDRTAPVITIAPIPAFTNQNVIPAIAVAGASAYTAMLNGLPYAGTVITEERSHSLAVSATDAAGNTGTAGATFTIDRTAPVITIAAIPPFTNQNVTPSITVDGAETYTATLNGAAYAGAAIMEERSHSLAVSATDAAGNTGTASATFTIDRTAPVITIAAIPPFTNQNVTPSITVDGAEMYTATLNGAAYAGAVITEERSHSLAVSATDAAGNTGTANATFTIDRTAPVITIAPIPPFTNQDVTPAITVDGAETYTATLNGAAYTGVVIIEERSHSLAVSATDAAGNTGTAGATFTIDRTAPVITIAPIPPFTNQNVTPSITVDGAETYTATLNGLPYAGTVIIEERSHSLAVSVTDAAGNTGAADATFTIDRTAPVITIAPIAAFTNQNVTPAITVSGADTYTATLNGNAYTAGTVVTDEREHALAASATDAAGNTATVTATFTIDRTAPLVEIEPIAPLTNQTVTPVITVNEQAVVAATLNGAAYQTGTVIAEERAYSLVVTATDRAGNTGTANTAFTIDRTPPPIAFTSPAPEALLGTRQVTVTGTAGDAVRVLVNTALATLQGDGTFTAQLELREGTNDIVAIAADAAGNEGTRSLRVHLDTRAPELDVLAPASGACIGTADVAVRVSAGDAVRVVMRAGEATPVDAARNGAEWSANVAVPEGSVAVIIEATDAGGHISRRVLALRVDRTRPVITAIESGVPFTATLLRRNVAPLLRVTDSDANATLAVTLDGAPYTSGTTIDAEGVHLLRASGVDCAGNAAVPLELTFTIDRTPPAIVAIAPAAGASVGNKPPLAGTLSEPATVTLEGTSIAATVNGLSFTIDTPLEEGRNELALIATDPAGNTSRTPYSLRVDTTRPFVEIVQNGLPIAPGALFNRALTPVIRVSDADATLNATLNSQPFTSGTAITADASYTLVATATDAFGRASNEASATFTIDRTPPHVDITSPADGSFATNEIVEVRGTVDADVHDVSVNGVQATVTGTTFTASVRVEEGPTVLAATAVDRAGNSARDHIAVIRNSGRLALLVTSPPDGLLTNRPTTVVAGQLLNAPPSGRVRVNGAEVAVDAAGAFRDVDFALVEGVNEITVSVASARDETNAVSVAVIADFTPPRLTVTANGLPLDDGAQFSIAPRIALDTDELVTTILTIDGSVVTAEPTLANGGHVLTVIARDPAGNEARVDRTFFIGSGAVVADCAFTQLDPADGAVVFGESVRITGRSGGAVSVLIDGHAAQVADGSFCGDATLAPGRNEVVIRCAGANGNPTSDAPTTIVFWRDVDPSIEITAANAAANSVTVEGTVSAGVVSGDVNGVPFTIAAGATAFRVPNVALAPGLNVLTARAKTGSGRTVIDTAHVTHAGGTPQLAITSPIAGTETGAVSIDVTGTYANVDPAAIRVGSATPSIARITDTTGTFSATASLASGALTTITANAGSATASVQVQHIVGAPSIAITSPLDNAQLASTFAGPLRVTGTVTAPEGSRVLVSGVLAAISGDAFSADIPLSTNAAPLAILARVTTPDSVSVADAIRVTRFGAPLALRDSFPAPNATGVDRGAAILLLFNNTLDGSSAASAIRLTDAANADVPGHVFTDRDAVTFAPDAPLRANETYAVTVSTALRDAANAPLASLQTLRFTTTGAAPATAPIVDDLVTSGCLSAIVLTGRASVPGARVRLDADGVALTAVASDSGAFRFTFRFSGQPGFHVARVRELGADGSLSPERALCFRINCELPRVLAASLDRAARKLTIEFSRAMNASTLTASTIRIVPDSLEPIEATVASDANTAVVTFASALPEVAVTLTVAKEVQDTSGATMTADYTRRFAIDDGTAPQGRGYVAGAVYDATTGRPLANATIVIDGTAIFTNDRGRYTRALNEGAWTIEARAGNYTSAWRQVVVPAGAGVVPIDIRLTRRNTANTFTHGGDTTITKRVDLTLSSSSVPPNSDVRLTALGAQSLPGLLPLGWSPLAVAEIVVDDSPDAPLPAASLSFSIDANAVGAANQTLSLVRYDSARDEWRTVVAVVAGPTFPIDVAGYYALVYPDAAPHLEHPAPPRNGAPLAGVVDRCAATPCALTGRTFTLEPRAILPSGRAAATLVTEGATEPYPSGTAVQATIDEQLNLSDGRVLVDPPFATDLLVYRTLAGDTAVADFHLAPTAAASAVTLRDGIERIRITDYPGRLDRGTLLGAQGGRIPGDGGITLDVPPGATLEPLHASTSSLSASDLAAFGSIAGFRIAGGFTLALTRTTEPAAAPAFLIPARATFTIAHEHLSTMHVVIVEVRAQTTYGVAFELIAIADAGASVTGGRLFTTRAIDSTELPLDGIVRDGRYLILVAEAPIAFAFGQVRAGVDGPAIAGARVTAAALGITSITRAGGVFALPVPAAPAAPFSLIARSVATGDGARAVASTSPASGAFVPFGVLPLVAQPPQLRGVAPDGGEVAVDDAFRVRAEFDVAIDPPSVANGIRVMNLTTGDAMSGTASAAGNIVTFDPGEPLRAASRYAITIAGTIRALSGAPFGQTVVKSFTTSSRPRGSTAFNPDRIRITIPDADGRVSIRGSAGALPSGSQALAVRRGRFFIAAYQATAASDGSFSFDAGHGDARDAITIDDVIDLQVVDAISHAVVAVIELTPFVRDDARAFIARHDRDTRFVSADGIVVTVPRGAFDEPAVIAVAPALESSFSQVPGMGGEVRFATAVQLTFDGIAKERIDVELPIPAGLPTATREWLIGRLGTSLRGPRIEIVDLAHVSGSTFRSGVALASGARTPVTNAALNAVQLRNHLLGLIRGGIYGVVDLNVPQGGLAWGLFQGLQSGFEYFWDAFTSLFVSDVYLTEKRGTIVVPIVTGKPFTVVGVDTASGLDAFSKTYEPIPPGLPGTVVDLADPNPDRTGPYPVFAPPFRVEFLDLAVEGTHTSIRDFTVALKNERVTVTTTLAAGIGVTLFNVTRGLVDASRSDGLETAGAVGDRIVLLAGERDVDPHAPLSIVFDEPIDDTALEGAITIETASPSSTGFVPITGALHMRTTADGRRVLIEPPASLTRGHRYRIVLHPSIRNRKGLHIAQVLDANGTLSGGLDEPLYLEMQVREPGDLRASFDLQAGVIRDQALMGNVLIVAAGEGGLAAYDVADPAGMKTGTPPMARYSGAADYWSLATDHHGRIYATGITSLFGVVHSLRLEDVIARQPALRGSAPVSYVPGSSSGLENAVAVDRVEAYPRRLQLLVQDTPTEFTGETFAAQATVTLTSTVGDLNLFEATFVRDPRRPYATQRVTVENTTLDLRWSADATATHPARIARIVARPGDQLRVLRNQTTYGVVSLFGYGVGVYDLNAIDSNDMPDKPFGYVTLREQIRVTRAPVRAECGQTSPRAIPDLTFTPDAAIVARPGSEALHVLALDSLRGVLDLTIDPASNVSGCDERAPSGLLLRDDPRLAKLRERFVAHSSRAPFVRFTGAARHAWKIAANDNAGERGSAPSSDAEREYLLVPANEFGLLVVEIGGTPPPALAPSYTPLQPVHLVDVIWVPGGAYAVKGVPRSNLAAVIDGEGHALLVDLSTIDQRWDGDALIADDELFRTAARVLEDDVDTPDPRIVWRSAEPLATGTLAPAVDPETGFIYVGKVLDKTTSVVAAIDPRLAITNAAGTGTLQSVVPHGIATGSGIADDSRGAFRVEIALPAAMQESLPGHKLTLAIDSERVHGGKTEDTPAGWPRAHLQKLPMRRVLPEELAELRHQSGANRWVSGPIAAIADPRASALYAWPANADRDREGCFACAPDPAATEIFSLGRFFRVRADTSVFSGSGYAHLAEQARLDVRIDTIPADVVRAPAVRVAAQHPPVAGGMLQETTYLHSGELETGATDFVFGGRAGWNVVLDRTYRSRSIGLSSFGAGWDGAIFQRLRELPDGTVEYRDGAEVWPFRWKDGQYVAPAGLFLRLTRTTTGWNLADQKIRMTTFDRSGRLTSQSDEFRKPTEPGSGNTIHYLYGADGRLRTIVDPVGRETTLDWDDATGLLRQVSDWRTPARVVQYEYDAQRRLTKVHLPTVSGVRPVIALGYQPAGVSFNELLETAPNLTAIVDPKETLIGGKARVTFTYELDRVARQQWATNESASFLYPSLTTAIVTDVLGQERRYTFTRNDAFDVLADRAHPTEMREVDVPVWDGAALGQLPSSIVAGVPQMSTRDRVETYTYDPGVLRSSTLEGVRQTTVERQTPNDAPGTVVKSVTATPTAPQTGPEIKRVLHYQHGIANGSTFLRAVESAGKTVESPEAHRNNPEPVANSPSDNITVREQYDAQGRLESTRSTGGTDADSAGSERNIEYWPDSAPKHKRGMPRRVRSGALETTFDYPTELESVETDSRGAITTTLYDEWGRVKNVSLVRLGDPLILGEHYAYDVNGRVQEVVQSRDGGDVTTRYVYDVMGRQITEETNQIATVGTMSTSSDYNLAERAIVTRQSGGAITTAHLDRLGRVTDTTTLTGSSPIEQRFAYDIAGNRVYETDLFTATASAYDAHGRMIATLLSDGTRQTTSYDDWDRPEATKHVAANSSEVVSESSYAFTDTGRLQSVQSKVDAGVTRSTGFAWDGGGRTTVVATNGRASETHFDVAGRVLQQMVGAGNVSGVADAFTTHKVESHDGALPSAATITDKDDAYRTSIAHNVAGDVTTQSLGTLTWQQTYDQFGNVTAAKLPNREATRWDVDARGAVVQELLPDGARNQWQYNATGAQSRYSDPENERTTTTTDFIGRPLHRTYEDGTTELFTWEGSRQKSYTDRQGRTQTYQYNAKGQLIEVREMGALADVMTYDDAGRLVSWKTPDAEIVWGDFNLDGAPKKTVQRRFRDGQVLDEFTQTHAWNEHGERTSYSMPVYPGMAVGPGWAASVQHTYDSMGNITAIARGSLLMAAEYRTGGRAEKRTLTTFSGATITRTYDYDALTPRLSSLTVDANGVTVAGSRVQYDGLQLSAAQLLGISSEERSMQWRYDERGRLRASLSGVQSDHDPLAPEQGRVLEQLTPADYRTAQERLSRFDSDTLAELRAKNFDTSAIDPPSTQFERRPGGGHKIGKVTHGADVRQFDWNASQRVDDGRFLYDFDTKGRIVRATEKTISPPTRRIIYSYSGPGRMVGRRAEYTLAANPAEEDWRLEDRALILDADRLPAETTYVWDVISDNLIAIYKSAPRIDDAHHGLLEQVIHGGAAYDDPIERTVADRRTGEITHLYPVYDEAAAGCLQAILNDRGEIVSRSLPNDPYGGDDADFTGPAVDGASVIVTKNATGAIDRVEIRVHATERLSIPTVASGSRLAAVDAAGLVLRTSSAPATRALDDPFTLRWTLTAEEWTTLTATPAVDLSVAATSALRAETWSLATPFMPAPPWATASQPVHTSPDVPVEIRSSLSALHTFAATIPAGATKPSTIYAIDHLALAAAPAGTSSFIADGVGARFQALPFAEPATGLVYVRARWYELRTGTFFSPDILGYTDSADLFMFCGADPVNRNDPTGLWQADFHYYLTYYLALSAGFSANSAQIIAEGAERPDQDDRAPIWPNWFRFWSNSQATRVLAIHTEVHWHFPKDAYTTGEVVPGSRAAREVMDAGRELGLIHVFAEGLHPFQDSWPHQGEPTWFGSSGHRRGIFPDVPLLGPLNPSNSNLANPFGDVPSMNQDVAYEAAQAVFTELVRFKREHPTVAGTGQRQASWAEVGAKVKEYIGLGERAQKRTWMSKHLSTLAGREVNVGLYWNDVLPGPSEFWGTDRIPATPKSWTEMYNAKMGKVKGPQAQRWIDVYNTTMAKTSR
jgi:RHS repeat-associated protein